jgi:hypothetical protein
MRVWMCVWMHVWMCVLYCMQNIEYCSMVLLYQLCYIRNPDSADPNY